MLRPCNIAVLLMVWCLAVFESPAAAHVVSPGRSSSPALLLGQPEGTVALDERLGAKLPLDLVFRDEDGRKVSLASLVTGPTIIVPVYYRCTNVCNYLQGGLAGVIPALKPRPGIDYRIISVSIDETETPQIAARMKRMHLASISSPFPADGWRFLTGDAASIRSLTDAAGYHFQRSGNDFIHPVACFIITRDGTIVRYLYGTTFLPKDVTLALLEAREGKLGGGMRHVINYCFSYDPLSRGYQFNLLRVSATAVILCCGSFLAYLLISGRSGRNKKKGKR